MENIGAVFFSVHRWFFLPPRGGSTGIFVPYTEKELACSEICKPDGIAVVFSITGGKDLPVFPANLMHKAGNGVTIWLQK